MLREVAKSLEISTNVLAWLLRYQLSREDPLLGDDLARKAIQTMDTVRNRPSLRQGSVAITIPETIAQRYDLNLYGPAIFDETTRRVLEHELSQTRPQEEHLALAHGEPETVVGTVQGGPSYTREGFTLRHPLYGEVRCHLGPNLVGAGSHEAQPGTKVLVSGILYSPGKGQVPIMEVMSIRPVP